ncbi:hypothetical protein [Paenisporosarcina sp. OV554]|uniref:hypothetical protein n=1 Tax=Paenisporosarcina sp. OV554 TaxID=2135694 RepID=UPI000D4601BD|nr:hypothetical protein [Paenisporosarcina sp. OV554]PUB12602.1 hypothetical protein C8K15_109101 [Paenisporosarcina sp. OV554]
MSLIYYELKRLVDDYYKCENFTIKEQILFDIKFLTEALIFNEQHNPSIKELINPIS